MKVTGKDRKFRFTAKLARVTPGGYYAVDVPEKISKAIGKRGPIPVRAVVNNLADFTASLSPAGGGRHRLRMNALTREIADAEAGDLATVEVIVLSQPPTVAIPSDLKNALRAEGVLEDFQLHPPGKQNHIIDWICESARQETREKRIQFTVEHTHRKRDKRREREGREAR